MLNQEVIFPPGFTTVSVGRNGIIITTGVYVDAWAEGITLTPRTSRGNPGRCNIELPNNPFVLMEFIRALLRCNPTVAILLQEEIADREKPGRRQ